MWKTPPITTPSKTIVVGKAKIIVLFHCAIEVLLKSYGIFFILNVLPNLII